jgi:hypothetical protein
VAVLPHRFFPKADVAAGYVAPDWRGDVQKRESFDSLLQALRIAWLRGCEAAAVQYQAARAGWMAVSNDGTSVPRRLVVQPPDHGVSAKLVPLEIDLADLCNRRWMRPASLSLSFDCQLRHRRDGTWQLLIVDADRRFWRFNRPRHRVEIVVNGQDDAGGEVRFDGHLLRRFGKMAETSQI